MSPADEQPTRVRRPRMSAEREQELLLHVVETLADVGYEALSMDLVAARARCSKSTLYRLWDSKPAMVTAALRATAPVQIDGIDTGTLRGDLIELITRIAERQGADADLLAALHNAMRTDPDLAGVARDSLVGEEASRLLKFVDRAVGRGELDAEPAARAHLPQLLFGAVTLRPMFDGTHADAAYLTAFVDAVILPALLHS